MSDRSIKITINPIGKPTVEAIGFNGVGCADATAPIERALSGGQIDFTRELKPEWNNEGEVEQQGVKW